MVSIGVQLPVWGVSIPAPESCSSANCKLIIKFDGVQVFNSLSGVYLFLLLGVSSTRFRSALHDFLHPEVSKGQKGVRSSMVAASSCGRCVTGSNL